MAKAILEFDLNETEDRNEHERMLKSLDLCLALWDMDQYLRSQTKYNESLTQEQWDILDETRTKLYEIMNAKAISLDDLLK
jgi:hypothetical protein